jgi:hypothetical protein
VIRHTLCIATYIADLIVYWRKTSSQGIKKEGVFWVQFWQKLHLVSYEIRLIAICLIKLITVTITHRHTKASSVCWNCDLQIVIRRANGEPQHSRRDKDLRLSQLIWFLTISRGLSVIDTYRKIQLNRRMFILLFSLFLHPFKAFITFLLDCVILFYFSR